MTPIPRSSMEMPFTVGSWQESQPVTLTLEEGENTLRFWRDQPPQYGLAIKLVAWIPAQALSAGIDPEGGIDGNSLDLEVRTALAGAVEFIGKRAAERAEKAYQEELSSLLRVATFGMGGHLVESSVAISPGDVNAVRMAGPDEYIYNQRTAGKASVRALKQPDGSLSVAFLPLASEGATKGLHRSTAGRAMYQMLFQKIDPEMLKETYPISNTSAADSGGTGE
jgi:hypothetical protein